MNDLRGHAICTCCIERTHPPDDLPTIVLGSAATYGLLHECEKCGTLCTLPGCYGRKLSGAVREHTL